MPTYHGTSSTSPGSISPTLMSKNKGDLVEAFRYKIPGRKISKLEEQVHRSTVHSKEAGPTTKRKVKSKAEIRATLLEALSSLDSEEEEEEVNEEIHDPFYDNGDDCFGIIPMP